MHSSGMYFLFVVKIGPVAVPSMRWGERFRATQIIRAAEIDPNRKLTSPSYVLSYPENKDMYQAPKKFKKLYDFITVSVD